MEAVAASIHHNSFATMMMIIPQNMYVYNYIYIQHKHKHVDIHEIKKGMLYIYEVIPRHALLLIDE